MKYTIVNLWIVVFSLVVFKSAGKDTTSLNIPYDFNRYYNCGNQQYRDSSKFVCGSCPAGLIVDRSTIDGEGDFTGCYCNSGFVSQEVDCSTVSQFTFNTCSSYKFSFFITIFWDFSIQNAGGNCLSVSCTDCRVSGQVSYTDRSACVPCGPSTLGYGGGSDCQCPTNHVLVEKDLNGAYAAEKSCLPCAAGTKNTIF